MSEHLRRQWREARTPGPSEQYLDQVTKMMATGPLSGRKYRSPMEAIRDRGKPWRNIAPSLRSDIRRGPMGNCFGNALNAVMADRSLIYVEGYAHSKFFPMAHAWVVDGNGTVYDPTWPEPGDDYFGIAFDTRWLMEYVANSGYTSVFGTEFIHDGLIDLLTKGIPDSAMNTTGARTASSGEMTWGQVKARFPDYTEQGPSGFIHSISELAVGGPTFDGEPVADDLRYTLESVPISRVRFVRYPEDDSRVQTIRGYTRRTPVLLVSRGGELLTVDGNHRLSDAEHRGETAIQAIVAHSPLGDRYQGRGAPGRARKAARDE